MGCSMITEAIEDLTARGALCVLVQEGDAKVVLEVVPRPHLL